MRPVGPVANKRVVMMTSRRAVECREVEPPAARLAADEVEGAALASLISPGTELNWYYDPDPALAVAYPVVPGYAAAFRVERVGSAVEGVAPGDVMLAPTGPHASHQRHPSRALIKVPGGLSPSDAPFARLLAVSMTTLVTTAARPPERIGISGLGLVGHLAASVFMAAGYDVVAWDIDPARRALAAGKGITVSERAPLPEGAFDDPSSSGELALVVECSGNDRAVLEACASVRKGGEVAVVGVPWRPIERVTAHELLRVIFHRFVVLRSGWEYEVPNEPAEFRHASIRENLTAAMRWLADGRVDTTSLATVVAPEDAPIVYERMLARTWPTLSAVFDWTGRLATRLAADQCAPSSSPARLGESSDRRR